MATGIKEHLVTIKCGKGRMQFDSRTIQEVEATRDMTNRKPFRDKAGRVIARSYARVDKNGAWCSDAPLQERKAKRVIV